MGQLKISDDMVWAKQIENDAALKERILNLTPGTTIDLEIAGIAGTWAKANVGKDGRPTLAIKPIGPMKDVWKRLQSRRGEYVTVRPTQLADSYLATVSGTMSEWNSPEDNEAFRDL